MSSDERGSLTAEPDVPRLRSAYDILISDPSRALEELQGLVASGSVMAMVYLGYAFEKGLGVEASRQAAMKWYARAAERGSPLAKSYLGGLLVQQGNIEEAKQLLLDESLRGDLPSMYWLANIAVKSQNIKEARQYLESAIKRGHIPSQRMLGGMLIRGCFGLISIPRGFWLCIGSVASAYVIAKNDPHSPRLRV